MFQLFKPDIKIYSSQALALIIYPLLKDYHTDQAFDDPDHSTIGGTAPYTYVNLLDKWYVMERNPKFSMFKDNISKLKYLSKVRGYNEAEINNLNIKEGATYRDCIITIIDHEFTDNNPLDQNGSLYKTERENFIKIIPEIEKYYLLVRKDKSIVKK